MMAAVARTNQKLASGGHREKGRSRALSAIRSTFRFTRHQTDVSAPQIDNFNQTSHTFRFVLPSSASHSSTSSTLRRSSPHTLLFMSSLSTKLSFPFLSSSIILHYLQFFLRFLAFFCFNLCLGFFNLLLFWCFRFCLFFVFY